MNSKMQSNHSVPGEYQINYEMLCGTLEHWTDRGLVPFYQFLKHGVLTGLRKINKPPTVL
jgi:hypothetical protein